jgi:hypothetical protein
MKTLRTTRRFMFDLPCLPDHGYFSRPPSSTYFRIMVNQRGGGRAQRKALAFSIAVV